MKITRTCGECGVPMGIARNLAWNPDGTITQRKDPLHRLIFFESENLDRLWGSLPEILGVTGEHIREVVVESKSRATRAFLRRTLPWGVELIARVIGYRSLMSAIESQGLVMGYGKITLGGQYPRRGRPERVTVYIEDPYSLPLFCGDFKGAAEVTERRDASLTYQALDSRRHQIDVTMGRMRLEEEEFAWKQEPPRKPGDVAYERCASCGSPLALKQFRWDLGRGIVRDQETGRRMALFGTASLEAVFEEIAHELGERVMGHIVDIERENTVSAMSVEEARSGYEGLRMRAAVRGFGMLTRLEMDEGGLRAEVANPAVPAYLVGLAAGIFELATGKRGAWEWSLKPDGDLAIEITPAP